MTVINVLALIMCVSVCVCTSQEHDLSKEVRHKFSALN